jgi:hypothetical protein
VSSDPVPQRVAPCGWSDPFRKLSLPRPAEPREPSSKSLAHAYSEDLAHHRHPSLLFSSPLWHHHFFFALAARPAPNSPFDLQPEHVSTQHSRVTTHQAMPRATHLDSTGCPGLSLSRPLSELARASKTTCPIPALIKALTFSPIRDILFSF